MASLFPEVHAIPPEWAGICPVVLSGSKLRWIHKDSGHSGALASGELFRAINKRKVSLRRGAHCWDENDRSRQSAGNLLHPGNRSEERRVGKERRSQRTPYH